MDVAQLENQLVSICNAIGGYEVAPDESGKERYVMGDECYDCLKDVKRMLRQDDRTEDKLVLRTLGRMNFVETDLIPIMLHQDTSNRLITAAVELLVPLTWPVDPKAIGAQEQMNFISGYKSLLSNTKVLSILFEFMLDPLAVNHRDRTGRDSDNIRLGLYLVRNLLHDNACQLTDSKSSAAELRDIIIKHLHESNITELLITMASSLEEANNNEWNLLLAELFYHLFTPYEVESIFTAMPGSTTDTLGFLMQKESTKLLPTMGSLRTRHNRFKGAFTMVVGDQARSFNSTCIDLHKGAELFLATGKKLGNTRGKGAKTTAVEKPEVKTLAITRDMCSLIVGFIVQFLESGFNVLMKNVKEDIVRERDRVRMEDVIFFFDLTSYLLAFTRNYIQIKGETSEVDYSCVAIILNSQSVIFAAKKLYQFYDEKDIHSLHATINFFKEILLIVDDMGKTGSENFKEVASNIQRNLFFDEEYLKMFRKLVRDPLSLNLRFFEDTVEMTHVFMRSLQKYVGGDSKVFVRKKKVVSSESLANYMNEEDDEPSVKFSETFFDFTRFEMGYVAESTVNNYMELLKNFRHLKAATLRHITKMFHRIFVARGMEAIFYRIDFLFMLSEIMERQDEIKHSSERKDLIQFIKYFTQKITKKLTEYPLLYVELLYGKPTKADWAHVQFGFDITDPKKKKLILEDPEAEIEVKPNLPWSHQVGVIVGLIIDEGKESLINWLVESMSAALDQRQASQGNQEATEQQNFELAPGEGEEITKALTENNRFIALLKLMKCEKLGDNFSDHCWIIPKTVLEMDLEYNMETVRNFVKEPLQLEKPLSKYIKRKATKSKRKKSHSDSEEEDESDIKSAKRKKSSMRAEDQTKFLSAQYVQDSSDDDDEEIARYRRNQELLMNGIEPPEVERKVIRTVSLDLKFVDREGDSDEDNQPRPTQSQIQENSESFTSSQPNSFPLDEGKSEMSCEQISNHAENDMKNLEISTESEVIPKRKRQIIEDDDE